MKLNKLFSALAVVTTAAMLTGCFNGVDLSEVEAEVNKYNQTKVTGTSNAYASSIGVTSNVFAAGKNFEAGNEFAMYINSKNAIDLETLSAIKVLGLKNNSNKYYPCDYDAELETKIVYVTSSETSGTYKTSVVFDVDLHNYSKDYLAVKIDATQLKDVKGIAFLNGNGNEVLGEETDTIVRGPYSVTGATDLLNNSSIQPASRTAKYTLTKSDDLNASGAFIGIKYTTDAKTLSRSATDGTYTYVTDAASQLGQMFKLQTKAPGAKEWVDSELKFEYVNANLEYEAKVPASLIPAGTEYRVVEKISSEFVIPSEMYTVQAKRTYNNTVTYTASASSTSGYYPASTTTIVSRSAMTLDIGDGDAVAAQKDCFEPYTKTAVTQNGFGAVFSFDFTPDAYGTDNGIKPGTEDFIVTTTSTYGYKLVDADVKVTKKAADNTGLSFVVQTKENTYKADDLLIWVGPKASLVKNETNSAQLNFGQPADASMGAASTYVALRSN